jgi:hypothetical protein
LSRAQELAQAHCAAEPSTLTISRMFLGAAWAYSGDYASIARHTGGWVDEARGRDDRFAFAALSGMGSGALRHLMRGNREQALDELEQAMKPWAHQRFAYLHLGELHTQFLIRSSANDGSLLDWLSCIGSRIQHEFVLRTPGGKAFLPLFRAAGLLLLIDSRNSVRLKEVLVRTEREVQLLKRSPVPVRDGLGTLHDAVISSLRGNATIAYKQANDAYQRQCGAGHYGRFGALYLQGHLEGGEAGRAKCASVLKTFADQGWADPYQALAIVLPGAHLFT